MAFYSIFEYTGDGVTNLFLAPDTIDDSYIAVALDNVNKEQSDGTNPWTVTAANKVNFTGTVPGSGVVVRVTRNTDKSATYKTFNNGPLDSNDMNLSFKKILHIEQESYDQFTEVSGLFSETGDLPNPGEGEANNYFLVTQNQVWRTKGPGNVRASIGMATSDDVTFASVIATSLQTASLSATDIIANNLQFDGIWNGDITLSGPGGKTTVIKGSNTNDLVINQQAAADIVLKTGNSFRWKIDVNGYLTNYETVPTAFDSLTSKANLIVSGSGGFLIAGNTPKFWGSCDTTVTGTPTISDNVGVSGITRSVIGVYDLDVSSGYIDASNSVIMVVNSQHGSTIAVYSAAATDSTTFRIKAYDPTDSSAVDPTGFHFIVI